MTSYQNSPDVKYDDSYGAGANANNDDEKPQYYSDIAEANPVSRRHFIKKVYFILFVQLLVTAGAGLLCFRLVRENEFVKTNGHWIALVFLVGAICCSCVMSCCADTVRAFPRNYIFLSVMTFFMSGVVGLSSAKYDADALIVSFGITAGLFLGLTVFAIFITKDFTGFGPYIFAALLVLALFGLAIFAFGAFRVVDGNTYRWLHIALSICGVLVFSFMIVYDTQQIVGGENRKQVYSVDDYVFAAISLYLSIVNLFMCILGLVGDS